MAYPASTKTLRQWLDDVDQQCNLLKNSAQNQRAMSLAGTLDMDWLRRFFDLLVQSNVFFGQAAAVAGLPSYVQAQKQGASGSANPVAEFTAMRAQVVATLDWLRSNVPQGAFGGSNYKLAFAFPADNVTPSAALTFTAGQTAGYRTVLDALIATIG